MNEAYICDGIRTPIGRYGGGLASVRVDDLAAIPLTALQARNPQVDWTAVDDVILGCANQAGEDNRNVARMALLLAGLPESVTGITVNRLCASGIEAVTQAARAIRTGEAQLVIAGGVEGMSRAPYVMGKADSAWARNAKIEDTTMGWRFVNPQMQARFGVDPMIDTAENVAAEFAIEITPVIIKGRKGDTRVELDEHPRADTTLDSLAKLKGVVRADGTVTAGNASGINDGSCALLLAGETAVQRYGLQPLARVVATATAGVAPRIMGIGPVPAVRKLLQHTGLSMADIDVIELNEAFAAQALAVTRQLGLADDDARVNPNGGAIALGHPLGASGARLALTAARQLRQTGGRYALCTMCIGVGQGIAMLIERV